MPVSQGVVPIIVIPDGATIGKIKKIYAPIFNLEANSASLSEYLNNLQEAESNKYIDENGKTQYYKLYYFEILDLSNNKIYNIFSPPLQNTYGGLSIIEVKSGAEENDIIKIIDNQIENSDKVANIIADRIRPSMLKDNDFIGNIAQKINQDDDFIRNISENILDELAIKVIDHMHLNGVDFTYSPTIAKVTIIDENGTPVNLELINDGTGIYKASVDLTGRFTIQISERTNL